MTPPPRRRSAPLLVPSASRERMVGGPRPGNGWRLCDPERAGPRSARAAVPRTRALRPAIDQGDPLRRGLPLIRTNFVRLHTPRRVRPRSPRAGTRSPLRTPRTFIVPAILASRMNRLVGFNRGQFTVKSRDHISTWVAGPHGKVI